jgi:hypothetical protein
LNRSSTDTWCRQIQAEAEESAVSWYLVLLHSGESVEIEADYYGKDGEDLLFTRDQKEVKRIPVLSVASVSKAK